MTRWRIVSAVIVLAVGGWVVYTFPPTEYAFYPRCVFKQMTGMDCPGCGSTRAMHHLLHGRVAEAFKLNPILFALMGVGVCALPSVVRGKQPRFFMQPWFAWGAFVVLTGWWIVRNTPWYPW